MGEAGAPSRWLLLQPGCLSLLLRMGCLGRKTLPFFLIFVPIYLCGALLQETAPERQRKPFLERLCRLEAQVSIPTVGGSRVFLTDTRQSTEVIETVVSFCALWAQRRVCRSYRLPVFTYGWNSKMGLGSLF